MVQGVKATVDGDDERGMDAVGEAVVADSPAVRTGTLTTTSREQRKIRPVEDIKSVPVVFPMKKDYLQTFLVQHFSCYYISINLSSR